MLNAVRYGKAGRVDVGGESRSWRDLYATSEDLLTASVFERLSYLPPALFLSILVETFGLELPFLHAPQLERMEYWPRWSLETEDTEADKPKGGKPAVSVASGTVEPDLFIRFMDMASTTTLDFIVEAKPLPNTAQCAGQWRREILAYHASEGEDAATVYFLAIGGLGRNAGARLDAIGQEIGQSSETRVLLKGASWLRLREALERTHGRTEGLDTLFADTLEALSLAGHRDWKLFDTLAGSGVDFEAALRAFQQDVPSLEA